MTTQKDERGILVWKDSNKTTDDDVCLCATYESYATGISYEICFDGADAIASIHKLFAFDVSLIFDIIKMVPTLTICDTSVHLKYVAEFANRKYDIEIILPRKEHEGENKTISVLRNELTVCRNKILQFEKKISDNDRKIAMLERYVGRLIVDSTTKIWERDPNDFINMCSIIDFSDINSIKHFYTLSGTIHNWLEPHKNYTNIKEDITIFIELVGKNINTTFKIYNVNTNIVSELINVMASDRIDIDVWKHITNCLKKNGADLNKVNNDGQKFIIAQLNKIAERKQMMVSYVLSELL
jgi:hypothetical protein